MKKATLSQGVQILQMIDSGALGREMAQAIIEGRVEIKPIVLGSAYRLHMSYAKLPGVAALEEQFSQYGVTSVFDGRAWQRNNPHNLNDIPGQRDFLVAEIPAEYLDKPIDSILDALYKHFDRLGYRFAIVTEAVEFASARPKLQCKNWILALGSWTLDDRGHKCVALLNADDRGRRLDDRRCDKYLHGDERLLLVRK